MRTPTKKQILAQVLALRDIGLSMLDVVATKPDGYPSGELYAHLMGKMSLDTYQRLIGLLKSAGRLEERNHLLFVKAKDGGAQ